MAIHIWNTIHRKIYDYAINFNWTLYVYENLHHVVRHREGQRRRWGVWLRCFCCLGWPWQRFSLHIFKFLTEVVWFLPYLFPFSTEHCNCKVVSCLLREVKNCIHWCYQFISYFRFLFFVVGWLRLPWVTLYSVIVLRH